MSKGNIMHYFPASDKMIASVGVSLKMNKELTLMIRGVLELL